MASSRLQNKKAAVFVLGIGNSLDTEELKSVASGPTNIFTVDAYSELGNRANSLKRSICILGNIFGYFCEECINAAQ